MFLDKYQNKKRLGKGAYGDVYLVEDKKGSIYALKLISVKMIEAEPHLREYLDG
jgi:serine/threonine protein kinase